MRTLMSITVAIAIVTLASSTARAQPIGPADMRIVVFPGRVNAPETVNGSGTPISSALEGASVTVQFGIRNFGPANGQPGLIEVLVNGAVQASGTNLTILAPGDQLNFSVPVTLPQVSGTTSINIVSRFDGIGDNVPGNNSGTKFFTVINTVPNLRFTPLPGSTAPLTLSTDGDPAHASTQFAEGDTLLMDALWTNAGNGSTPAGYPVDIQLDGVSLLGTPQIAPPLGPGQTVGFNNVDLTGLALPPGDYTLSVILDIGNLVPETDETDNVATVAFTITGSPDLAPALLPGWDDAIVVSTEPGTHTQAAQVTSADPLFIDVAWGNFGDGDAGPFDLTVNLFGPVRSTFASPGLASGAGQFLQDLTAGPLPPGEYLVELVLDTGEAVEESDEGNNSYEFGFTVIAAPTCPGDVNGDGATNAADFTILAGNFGASVVPNTNGDLNGDGLVNAADFTILAGAFGCV